MPANRVTPIAFGLERLLAAVAYGKLTCASIIDLVRANVLSHVVELHFETAFLARFCSRDLQRYGNSHLILIVTLVLEMVSASVRAGGGFKTKIPGCALWRVGHFNLVDDQGFR